MPPTYRLASRDEDQLRHLAEIVAAIAQRGDLIALEGDLGAGKSTFARALIRRLAANPHEDVPSPTFTLVQSYETPRLAVSHLDLYRLDDPHEVDELGIEHALERGIALVEWPERGGDRLPQSRLTIRLTDAVSDTGIDTTRRDIEISGTGTLAQRAFRLHRIAMLIERTAWSGTGAHVDYLQGDASVRRYAGLTSVAEGRAVLMDWPRQPDGPPIRHGKPYSAIAHLAEDVRPFVAIADALRDAGIAAPEIYASDLDAGLLVLEHLGDDVFGRALQDGASQRELWQAAIDVLVHLRGVPADRPLAIAGDSGGATWTLPRYDAQAMGIEVELLADWLYPFATGTDMPADARAEFIDAWQDVIARLGVLPTGWALRDFHSPNLIWRSERQGLDRVGVIDFQDALQGPLAYDLVSLTQDARLDVAPALEAELLDYYCAAVRRSEPAFDEAALRFAYAALGAQRNTKILGIFARLAKRDGKPVYIQHMPRIWGYLARALAHPELAQLRSVYDRHIMALAER
jgi:tRNA threonylcarbamoyl adenosine modification protein YjeE